MRSSGDRWAHTYCTPAAGEQSAGGAGRAGACAAASVSTRKAAAERNLRIRFRRSMAVAAKVNTFHEHFGGHRLRFVPT